MRWTRPITLTLITVALLIGVALLVLVNLDANRFKGNLERYVAAQTGRSFKITGSLDVDFGRHTRLTVDSVNLGNTEWAASDAMAKLDQLTIVVDLWSLFDKPLVIERFELSGAQVHLETQQDGTNNWTFGAAPEKDTRDGSKPIPLILQFARVDDFQLTYLDPELRGPLRVQVASFEQKQGPKGLLEASLEGTINGRAVTVNGQYGPLNNLLAGRDFDYRISGTFDTLAITSGGHIDDLLDPTHPELNLAIKGPDIDHVTEMLGLTDLGSGDMDLDVALSRQGEGLEAKIHGNLGEFLIDADGYASALTELRESALTISASGPNL